MLRACIFDVTEDSMAIIPLSNYFRLESVYLSISISNLQLAGGVEFDFRMLCDEKPNTEDFNIFVCNSKESI